MCNIDRISDDLYNNAVRDLSISKTKVEWGHGSVDDSLVK